MVSGNSSASSSATTTEKTAGEPAQPDMSIVNPILFPDFPNKIQKPLRDDTESKRDENGRYTYFYKEVGVNDTKLRLTDLKHFSAYTIHVKACREGPEDNCSVETSTPARTKKLGNRLIIKSTKSICIYNYCIFVCRQS